MTGGCSVARNLEIDGNEVPIGREGASNIVTPNWPDFDYSTRNNRAI